MHVVVKSFSHISVFTLAASIALEISGVTVQVSFSAAFREALSIFGDFSSSTLYFALFGLQVEYQQSSSHY